jgi:hypothetical protein
MSWRLAVALALAKLIRGCVAEQNKNRKTIKEFLEEQRRPIPQYKPGPNAKPERGRDRRDRPAWARACGCRSPGRLAVDGPAQQDLGLAVAPLDERRP